MIAGLVIEYPIGKYCIDIAQPERKIAIEVDGSYWHRDKLKKRRRNYCLKTLGWTVIHVPANEAGFEKLIRRLEAKNVI
jgi:very-short-patch-repair endonuclease